MEDDLLKKFKLELAYKFMERFKCNVCFERVNKPLHFCRTGHLCCAFCQSDLQDCPLCHEAFSKDKNITLEQILEVCIFPCKNEMYGCKVIDDYHAINKHENFDCDFQQFQCFLSINDETACNETITLCHFKEHIKNKHLERKRVSCNHEIKRDLKIGVSEDFETFKASEVIRDEKNLETSLFFVENLSYEAEEQLLSVTYYYVGLVNDAKKYKYFVTIKNVENSTEVTAQNKCLPVELSGGGDLLKHKKCVKIGITTFDDDYESCEGEMGENKDTDERDEDEDGNDEKEHDNGENDEDGINNEDESGEDGNNEDESGEDEEVYYKLVISVVFDFAGNKIKWDFGSRERFLASDGMVNDEYKTNEIKNNDKSDC